MTAAGPWRGDGRGPPYIAEFCPDQGGRVAAMNKRTGGPGKRYRSGWSPRAEQVQAVLEGLGLKGRKGVRGHPARPEERRGLANVFTAALDREERAFTDLRAQLDRPLRRRGAMSRRSRPRTARSRPGGDAGRGGVGDRAAKAQYVDAGTEATRFGSDGGGRRRRVPDGRRPAECQPPGRRLLRSGRGRNRCHAGVGDAVAAASGRLRRRRRGGGRGMAILARWIPALFKTRRGGGSRSQR